MFGNSGYNPKGIRVGGSSQNKSAIKVWEKREFRNLDDKVSLNTRNIQIALKRLRKFVRQSSKLEFDLKNTISSTSKNAGILDIKYRPERTNKVRVLFLLILEVPWMSIQKFVKKFFLQQIVSSKV